MEYGASGKVDSRLGSALTMAVDHAIGIVSLTGTQPRESSLPASLVASVRSGIIA